MEQEISENKIKDENISFEDLNNKFVEGYKDNEEKEIY